MMRNALFPCPQLFIRFHTFIRKGEFCKTFSSLSPTSEVSFTNSSMRSPSSLFCSDTCVAEVESLFWLAIEELDMTDDSNCFPVVFILTLWGILQKKKDTTQQSKNFHRLMVAPLRSTLTRISHQADTREKNSSRWQRNLHLPELRHHLYRQLL